MLLWPLLLLLLTVLDPGPSLFIKQRCRAVKQRAGLSFPGTTETLVGILQSQSAGPHEVSAEIFPETFTICILQITLFYYAEAVIQNAPCFKTQDTIIKFFQI